MVHLIAKLPVNSIITKFLFNKQFIQFSVIWFFLNQTWGDTQISSFIDEWSAHEPLNYEVLDKDQWGCNGFSPNKEIIA